MVAGGLLEVAAYLRVLAMDDYIGLVSLENGLASITDPKQIRNDNRTPPLRGTLSFEIKTAP